MCVRCRCRAQTSCRRRPTSLSSLSGHTLGSRVARSVCMCTCGREEWMFGVQESGGLGGWLGSSLRLTHSLTHSAISHKDSAPTFVSISVGSAAFVQYFLNKPNMLPEQDCPDGGREGGRRRWRNGCRYSWFRCFLQACQSSNQTALISQHPPVV